MARRRPLSRCARWLCEIGRRTWFPLKVRQEQSLLLPITVTVLIGLYVWLSLSCFLPVINEDLAWTWRQQCFCWFEAVMVIFCLWSASLTDPGRVPKRWNGTNARPVEEHYTWCRPCEDWKPPRTHHCSMCDRCVARYDHHCDWIDNCVGQRNQKYFLLFLWYITVLILHFFFLLYHYLFNYIPYVTTHDGIYIPLGHEMSATRVSYKKKPLRMPGRSGWEELKNMGFAVFLFLYFIAAVLLFLFAASFCFFHTKGAFENLTSYDYNITIERYGRGPLKNLCEVLGRHPLLWLVPTPGTVVVPKPRDDLVSKKMD